jgi:rhodanese-related sulfurtransferase
MKSMALFAALFLNIVTLKLQAMEDDGSKYSEIERAALKRAIEVKKVVLIDCNGTKTYRLAHIPGAIDYEANKDKLAELLPQDKGALIVSYCSGGNCPKYKMGASAAIRAGYTNVKVYLGGLHEWRNAGEPTESVN